MLERTESEITNLQLENKTMQHGFLRDTTQQRKHNLTPKIKKDATLTRIPGLKPVARKGYILAAPYNQCYLYCQVS